MHRSAVPLRPLLAAALCASLGCATASPAPAPAPAAPSLEVPAGNTLLTTLHAKGAQIYTCAAGKDGAFAWTFKAPQADLADAAGAAAGKHYAGPTWEWLNGGNVVGEVLVKAPPVGANIPMLLLKVKSAKGTSPYGSVAFIQRLATVGGVAPAAGCDAGLAGTEAQVPYTADYAYWGTK
jgi:hypothetical protein